MEVLLQPFARGTDADHRASGGKEDKMVVLR